MAVQVIPELESVSPYPQRKDPQDRFDTLIKEAIDGGSKAVSELNTKFIPNYNTSVPVLNWIDQNREEILAVDNNAAAALTSKNAAKASQDAAKTSETNAAAFKASAENSAATATAKADVATTGATTATTKASAAATSASEALASKNSAATSASTATTKAAEASTSATNAKASETSALASKNAAATSEANAKTSETNAAASKTSAENSAATATAKATAAGNSASAALTSQNAAKTSETNAAGSASTATAKATAAATSAAEALASKNAAGTSAATATTKAADASTSATNAATSAAQAANDATRAETAAENAEAIVGGNYAMSSRKISAGAGLSGGGDLTADRTLAVKYGTAAGTACQGDDARLSNARTPTGHAASHQHGGTDAITSLGPVSERSQALGTISGATTIDLSAGLSVSATLGGATTLAFSNTPSDGTVIVVLRLTNGGSAILTWPSSTAWPGGIAPVLSTAGLDIVLLETDDGGVNWTGVIAGIGMGVVA